MRSRSACVSVAQQLQADNRTCSTGHPRAYTTNCQICLHAAFFTKTAVPWQVSLPEKKLLSRHLNQTSGLLQTCLARVDLRFRPIVPQNKGAIMQSRKCCKLQLCCFDCTQIDSVTQSVMILVMLIGSYCISCIS